MKKILIFVCLICISSCKKEPVQYDDTHLDFIYNIGLDNLNRIVAITKTYTNNVIIEQIEFIYGNDIIKLNRYNPYKLLIEKKIYFINSNGFADKSIDTLFGSNMIITNQKYKYENDYITEVNSKSVYYQNNIKYDSIDFLAQSEYLKDKISKTTKYMKYFGFPCKDLFTSSDKKTSIEIDIDKLFLGKKTYLVKSITLDTGCPLWSFTRSWLQRIRILI
jgi:hypothetical protein